MKTLIAFSTLLSLTTLTPAATYKGQNIDGKKYGCVAKSASKIVSGSLRFEGRTAYLYLDKEIVTVKLNSEEITNLRDIEATGEKEHSTLEVSLATDSDQ